MIHTSHHEGHSELLPVVCAAPPPVIKADNDASHFLSRPASSTDWSGRIIARSPTELTFDVRQTSFAMRSFDVLYTVNGSDPSVYGILYDPIRPPVLTVSRTVKAITRTLDLEDSVVSVSQFVVHQVAAPTFSPPTVEGTICDSGAARTILFEDNWVNCVDGQPLRDSGGQLVPEPKPAEYAFDETRASYVTTRWGRAPHRFDVGGEPITIHVHSDTEDEPPECLPGCAGTANVNNDGCGAAPTPGNNVQIYYTLQGKIPTDPNFRADSADPGTIISAPDTCRILIDGIRLCGPDPATESGTSISDTFLLPGPCDPWFANGDTEASHACPCITGEECSTVREYDPALGITLRGGTFESVDGRVTVTAYAKKVGFTDSDVVQAGYVMKAKMPSMFPCGFGGGGGNPSCLGTGETWVGGTYVDLITETTNYGAMVTDIKYQRECLANTPYAEGMVRYNDAMPPYIPLSCNLIAFTTRSGLENSDTTRAAYQVQMLKPRFTVADGTYCDDGQDMTTPLESEDDAIGGTPTIGVVISIENHICSDQDGPYPSGFNAAAPLASPLPTRNQDNENRWHRLGPIANGLAHLSGSGELDSCNGTQMAYPWSTDSTAATGGTCSDAAPGTCSNGCGAPVCNVQRDAWIFYNIMYTDFADSLVDADAQYTAEPSYVGSIPRTDADVSLLAGVLGDPAAVNNLVSGSFENGSYAYSYADHDGDYYGYSKYTPCSPPDGSDVITTCKFSVRQSCVIKAISEHYSMVTSDVATGNFKVRMAAPCPCVQCPCPAADPVCPFTGTPVSENPAAPNGDVVLTSVSGTASIGTTCDCNLCSRLAATSANAGVKATCNAFCGSFEATAEQPCKAGQYEISAVSLPLWSESPRKVVPGANMPDHGRVEVWYSTDDLAMKLSDMIPGGEMDPNNPSDAFFSMGASSGGVCTDGSDGIVKPSRSTKVRVDSTTFNSNDRMQPATSGDAYDTPGRLFVDQMVGAQAKRCFFGSTDPAYCADIQCVGGDDDNCATPAGDKNMLDEPDKRYPDASFRKDYLGLCPRTWTPLRLAWPTHNEMARTFRPNMNHADFNTTCAPPASWAADYYGSREPGTTATVCAFTAAVVVEATVCTFTAAVTDPTDASVTAASCAKTSASAPGACAVNDAGTGCDGDADAVAASQPATCDVTSVAGTIASCAVTSGPGSCALNGDSTGCDGAADAVAGPASDASCAVASGPGTCLVNADGTDGCTGATDAVAMGSTTAASDASCAVASGTGTCLVNADSTACDATDTAVCTFTIAQVADPAAATEATVCTFTAAVVPADATVCAFTAADESSGSIPTSEVIEAQCILCNEECRESLITHMGDYSLPVLYGVCGTFFFTMIAIFCNAGQLTHDEPPGWVRLLSMNMNGLTSLCGLIMAILGTYAQYTIADECPADADCTNYVAVVIIILGVGLFVTGGIGLGGAFKHLTPLLFVVNIIELVFALMLFIAGIFLAIIAGAMDTVNSQSDEHFDVLRAQYEQRYPNYCSNLGPPVTPMSEIDCRAKIAEDVESNLLIVGIIGLIVAAYFAVVIFFTYHCIQHMREDGKDNDDELDEEALDSELESTE